MKQESNDIKSTAAQVVTYAIKGVPGQGRDVDMADIKLLVPILVNGTRERNTTVRSCSEVGLAVLLGLKTGEDFYEVGHTNFSLKYPTFPLPMFFRKPSISLPPSPLIRSFLYMVSSFFLPAPPNRGKQSLSSLKALSPSLHPGVTCHNQLHRKFLSPSLFTPKSFYIENYPHLTLISPSSNPRCVHYFGGALLE